MRLENVLALTHGSLVNEPFVKLFTNVVYEAKAVKRGDLFMAFDEESIEDAILNGAYGILFSKPTQISDSEIAWIKVSNLENALLRLLRFQLIDKNVTVYETNEIVLKLALQVFTTQNFIAIHGDILSIAEQLRAIEVGATILFCPTLSDKSLFTNIITLSNTNVKSINIIEQTLFETSFIYKNIFYERQLISPFFIPYLETLLYLFQNLKIEYRLKKFTPIDHFEPIFTNKNFEIKEFGTTDKVLIFEKESSLLESELLFLKSEATWAKIIYILPYSDISLAKKIEDKKSLILYENKNDILNLLRERKFNFALIIGVTKEILEKTSVTQTQLSLFDFE